MNGDSTSSREQGNSTDEPFPEASSGVVPKAHAPVPTYQACGVDIAALDGPSAAAVLVERSRRGAGCEVHLCNAYTLSLVASDPELRSALGRAHLNLPDGAPVAWLGRHRGTVGPVRGPELMRRVLQGGVPHGVRHYLLGGAPGVAGRLRRVVEHDYPGVLVVGEQSPPFRAMTAEDADGFARDIEQVGASVVWLGLGTPRQDYAVALLAGRLPHVVLVPVGAAFDFLTGDVKEAPAVLHGTGLEWLYRLSREPHRLWRRYTVGNLRFLYMALRTRRRA